MNISGDAPFHEILKQVNGVTIPDSPHDDEHTRYAMLELINNSLRAHREKGIKDKIRTEMIVDGSSLGISITDKGGGFDTSVLPYDLNEEAGEIDTNSGRFQEYRELNQYKKFGMGLIVAKRLFPKFKVSFYSGDGTEVPYTPGETQGTRIEMGMELTNG